MIDRRNPTTVLSLARRLPRLSRDVAALTATLASGGAGRLGDSAVVSRCVHLLRPSEPDAIIVLRNRDAGQLFYGRRPGQVVHVDVFHSLGEVPPAKVARALADATLAWRDDHRIDRGRPGQRGDATAHADGPRTSRTAVDALLDRVDLQTAVGGGRATGRLEGGRRSTLRLAHRNHVHLAAQLDADELGCLPYLVAAVELAIAATGLQVRAMPRLRLQDAPPGTMGRADLRAYTDSSDSLLRAAAAPPPAPRRSREEWLALAVSAARDAGDPDRAADALQAFSRGPKRWAAPGRRLGGPTGSPLEGGAMLERWQRAGWLSREGERVFLTPEGRRLQAFLQLNADEVRLALRGVQRRLSGSRHPGSRASDAADRGRRAAIVPAEPSQPRGELALPETVLAAAARQPFALRAQDIRVQRRRRPRPLDLVLVLDASASMAGARIRATQELTRHLLSRGRDRVAVISFQDREATVRVPLTRNHASVERGLARLRPNGLTPLATALQCAQDYLAGARPRRPLVLLVTDGIPTVSRSPLGPLEDALQAADGLARARVPFSCVGLEPNRGYLAQLAERAGGTLYVVEELQQASLIEIAEREQRRHRPRARVT